MKFQSGVALLLAAVFGSACVTVSRDAVFTVKGSVLDSYDK